jgi:hypothetical protein
MVQNLFGLFGISLSDVKMSDKKYKCPKCEYIGRSELFLNYHLVNIHKKNLEVYICPYDNSRFKELKSLKVHLKGVHLVDDLNKLNES